MKIISDKNCRETQNTHFMYIFIYIENRAVYETRIKSTLHEEHQTFSIICRSVLLRMKSISDKNCRETQNTYFMYIIYIYIENRAVYEIMCNNLIERAGHRWQYGARASHAGYLMLQLHTLRLCNTHCFSTQPRSHERASKLRYAYIACLVELNNRPK